MKSLLIVLILSMGLSCNGGGGGGSDSDSAPSATCANKFVGQWISSSSETITISSSCSFASDLCQSSGSTTSVSDDSGSVTITISQDAGITGCLPSGANNCIYVLDEGSSPRTLSFTCTEAGISESYDEVI
ncbi:MAG: hypothetical protein R3213_00855 [Flavobacteriaceae bacterium]|nr:hypothetical protein [Flavobacteriaceae bacterium]